VIVHPLHHKHRARTLALARTGYGMVLLAAPSAVLELVRVEPENRSARRFVRLLGARHLTEGVALVLWPSTTSSNWAAATDLAHAASVAILAWRLPAHRRSLAANGATALTLAALSLAPDNRPGASRR
jgi:hypothetical protein